MPVRALLSALCSILLLACEAREIGFCERYLRAGLGDSQDFERLDLHIETHSLTPLEAQRLVFPNYRPNAYFPNRPGRTSFILDALSSFPASLREIQVTYAIGRGNNRRQRRGTCRFLRLSGNPQFVSNLHLHGFIIRKAMAADSTLPAECCIRTNAKVR